MVSFPSSPTLDGASLLSPAQIEQYRTDGYCVVEGLWEPAEIDAIEAFFEDFKNREDVMYDGTTRFAEMDKTKKQVRAMHPHRYSQQALGWALQPRVMAVLETLLERPALLAQTM